jgi:succinate-semialdehyde dehydrogenase/glutarate-semialdehyde dehydrogenase
MTLVADELTVVNPATTEVVATVPATPPDAVPGLVAEAQRAQERWAAAALGERRELLVAVAELLLDRLDEVADTLVAETGKPRLEAFATDLFPAADSVVWAASNAGRVLAPERIRGLQPILRHKRAWLVYEPLGVIAAITPWNFPFSIPLSAAAFAVAAGNAVVLKPSELTPLSGAAVARLFTDAGAPAGLVQVAQGDGRVGEALSASPLLGKVVFTGSPAAGRSVAAAAGANLVPVTLELGGKDPMLVLDDADLDRAVAGALWGGFVNAGQVCAGVERIYVDRTVYEPFVDGLARRAAQLRPGDEVGPLISEGQRARVEELVADAVARGAEARAGARAPVMERTGWFYEPTVLVNVPPDARIDREEIFGPVVTVAPVAGDDEAVAAANDSAYGLSASVWTRDPRRAARVGRRLVAGSVWHNDVSYSYGVSQASWGGRKSSGFGRTHSRHGLYDLSAIRFVDRDAGRVPVPWWYPYEERSIEGFRGAIRVLYRHGARAKVGAAWRDRRGLAALGRRYLG